ncbi:alpha-glucuronidase family glycosyl hydrolase [Paenibacillus terreus]|uniref:Xylan alpha-1,2-glucuronidase n=1 Tax=Paenibacillus terreus TaxID=1387834 RepID=A0ABV5BDE1_9BACL
MYNYISADRVQSGYEAWLRYRPVPGASMPEWCASIAVTEADEILESAVQELERGIASLFRLRPSLIRQRTGLIREYTGSIQQAAATTDGGHILIGTFAGNPQVRQAFTEAEQEQTAEEGYRIRTNVEDGSVTVAGQTAKGVLYGAFHLLRLLQTGADVQKLDLLENPSNPLRMINQWDNMDGSIERGYAGRSIFYKNNEITKDMGRIRDYARLLASAGLNAIAINNVNVHRVESQLITERFLPDASRLAAVFRSYGIRTFFSINYASPIEVGGLATADPLDPEVAEWWKQTAHKIYAAIPDFGGFLVKADSENRPGPFSYGRNHAEGANMLAEALQPYGGLVIWRCFVYNCKQDWRDRSTDRARAAYDHFKPLDGLFHDNVILQVKNGPMDFQVREPVSPLFGAMERTNLMLEFQITQEYTGQQRHLCYLVPQWKEVLNFDTYARGKGSTVKQIADGSLFGKSGTCGIAAVSNIGSDANWTGHLLAQSNLYGYGRLTWNPELSAEGIANEWIRMTFGSNERVIAAVSRMLLDSWSIYESYTAPLGVGWMVNPDHHYGPNVDGYEYSKWGTYHFADCSGIGVNRTAAGGTGYAAQYIGPNTELYESLESCPDELLLFFHHVPYTHVLHSGKTVIQHIYDSHFEGAERAAQLMETWMELKEELEESVYQQVLERLEHQTEHAGEWRDMINTYFFRKSGIPDVHERTIY